jgi:hypothetical protein
MARIKFHDLNSTTPQLEENFANVFAIIIEMIGFATKAVARKRWKEYMARMLQGENKEMEELRKRLEKLVHEGTALVVQHINTNVNEITGHTSKTAMKIDGLEVSAKNIGVDVVDVKVSNRIIMDLLQQQHQSKNDADLYDLLRPAQHNTDKMESILRDRVGGTGQWIHLEPAFQSWVDQRTPLLWICGHPGCGKTFLASSVASWIQSNIGSGGLSWQNRAIGFCFVSKNDRHTRVGGLHQALRDVAWQITRYDPAYAQHVASQCRSWADIETLPSAWRKLFASYFNDSSRSLYLIIDGLDEAEEDGEYGRSEFLKLLPDLHGKY